MKKRACSILLALTMAFGLALPAGAADTAKFSDVADHWAESAIVRWADYGVIKGADDGTFKPGNNITRGDLALMLYRMMGYSAVTGANPFTDLPGDAYYADAVRALNHAGMLKGDGTAVRPADNITRQEIAVLLARVLGLAGSETATSFTDVAQIADWALPAVNAMTEKGYFVSGSQGFRPQDNITRAEVATLLDRAFPAYVNTKDTLSSDVTGNVLVTASGAVLKNMKVTGDIIIAEGVGEGDVVLENVSLAGNLLVRGGGANSIYVKRGSSVDNVIIARRDGKVRVVFEGDTAVSAVVVDHGSDNVKIDGKVPAVNVLAPKVKVEITGTVQDVKIAETAEAAVVTVSSGAKVGSLTTAAPKGEISVAGAVTKIETVSTATNTSVKAESGADITKVVAAGEGTQISGGGKVAAVEAKADNISVTTGSTKVTADEGVTGTTAGDKAVGGGETSTTPPSTGGSGGGGSSGGGSDPVPTYAISVSLKKDSSAVATLSMSGLSGGSKFYSALTTFLANEQNKTALTNGLGEMIDKMLTSGVVAYADPNNTAGDKVLTAEGQALRDTAVARYNTLKTKIEEVVVSDSALTKVLNALDPATLFNGNTLYTAREYCSKVTQRVEDLYTGIKGLTYKAGKSASDLAKALRDTLAGFDVTMNVTQSELTAMITAVQGDYTVSQWKSSCPGTVTFTYTAGNGVPAGLRGTYAISMTVS